VQVCTITSIAMSVGANRIVPAQAIPHPLGNPELSPGQEKLLRRKLVDRALAALQAPIDDQTIFSTES